MKNINKTILGIGLVITSIVASVVILETPISKVNAAESPNILVGRDLTMGSTGQDVVVLQGLLSELGYLNVPYGIPFGYYGPLTRDAVSKYQASLSVSPAVGYFGPVTKTTMHSHFASRGWLAMLGW